MVITTTAVAFILLSLGLGICGWRFLMAFRKTKKEGKIGTLLSVLFIGFAVQNGIIGMGALLFAKNPEGLYLTLVISHFFLGLVAMLGVYTAFYIFLPHRPPHLFVVLVGMLSITMVITTAVTHPRPLLTPQNGIDWNMNFPLSLLTFYLLLVSIGSTLYIFGKLFLSVKVLEIRALSFALAILGLAGIVNVFVRLVLLHHAAFTTRTRLFDVGLALIGVGFVIGLVVVPAVRNWILSCRGNREG